MRKILLIIPFIFLLTLLSGPTRVFALDENDVTIEMETPSITPPDYSKNECPVCGKEYNWMGDRGCCKTDIKIKKKLLIIPDSVEFKFICQQPNIIYCQKKFLCISGEGCLLSSQQKASFLPVEICAKLGNPSEQKKCTICMNDGKHVWSAVGCLSAEFSALISAYFLPLSLSAGGAVSFLMFLYGAFIVITSAGDVKRVTLGKKHIASSLKGLLLIIFAVFILKVISIDLLRIPGFG